MESLERRAVLHVCAGISAVFLSGCSGTRSDEGSPPTREVTTNPTAEAVPTDEATTDETPTGETTVDEATTDETTGTTTGPAPSAAERLPFTVFSEDVTGVITTELSSTAECRHAVALATDASDRSSFDWTDAKSGREFARATDFGQECLLAVRTTSPGPMENEVDWITRETETTLRVHATATAVPGPSTRDTETRLVRVGLDGGPAPSKAVVVRTTDYDRRRFTVATDDATCPAGDDRG